MPSSFPIFRSVFKQIPALSEGPKGPFDWLLSEEMQDTGPTCEGLAWTGQWGRGLSGERAAGLSARMQAWGDDQGRLFYSHRAPRAAALVPLPVA